MSESMETFENYEIHGIARDCWERGLTGVLRTEVQGYSKDLFFRDGLVIFANSEDPANKLPQVLISQGRFTEEQFDAVEGNFRPEISVGRNLVEMGLITQQELVEGARAQVFHVFESVMQARDGRHEVQEGPLPDGVVNLPLNFPADFLKAFLTLQDRAWVSSQFGEDLGFVPHRVDDRPIHFDQVPVADFAQTIYDMIDGETDGNHLAFETDVEDFTLLKFLYALKAMGFISVDVEAALDPGDESLLDDDEASMFAAELNEVVNQNDRVEQLGMAGLEETMEIGGAVGAAMDEALPSMDATVELSRANLGAPEPESIFADDEEAEEPEVEEDYDAAIAAFEADDDDDDVMVAEPEITSAFDDEEEDEGFDDLSSDLLEKELEAMAHPMGAALDEEPLVRNTVDEDDDEAEQDDEEALAAVGSDSGYQRRMLFSLLLLCLGGFGLAWHRGLVDPVAPLARFGVGLLSDDPPPDLVVDENADLAMVETDEVPPDAATAENTDSTTPETDQPIEAKVTDPEAQAQSEPEAIANQAGRDSEPKPDPVVAEAEPPKNTTPQEPIQVEPVKDPVDDPASQTAVAAVVEEPQKPQPEPSPAEKFVSPVAGGWDPATGRPIAGYQPGVGPISQRQPGFALPDLPRAGSAMVNPPADSPWASLLARREPGSPFSGNLVAGDPAVEAETVKASVKVEPTKAAPRRTNSTQNKPKQPPPATTNTEVAKPTVTVPGADPFADVMRRSQAALTPQAERFTLRLFLACQPSSVEKAQTTAGAENPLYLLPRDFRGRTCYSVCWGVFDSRLDALEFRKQLPQGLVERLTDVEVYQIKKLL